MKKITWMLGLVFVTILPALAQKDKRAQDILDAMSKRYKALKSYQAVFTFTSVGGGSKESYKAIWPLKTRNSI